MTYYSSFFVIFVLLFYNEGYLYTSLASFSSKEIHKFADDNDFEILEENDGGEYFWFTFQLKK